MYCNGLIILKNTYSQAITLVSPLADFLDLVPDGEQCTRKNIVGTLSHSCAASKACQAISTGSSPDIVKGILHWKLTR